MLSISLSQTVLRVRGTRHDLLMAGVRAPSHLQAVLGKLFQLPGQTILGNGWLFFNAAVEAPPP